jgi:hypothetical protein
VRPRPRRLPPPLNLHLSLAEAQALLHHLEAVKARRAALDADPVLRACGLPHTLGPWLTILIWRLRTQLVPGARDKPGGKAAVRPGVVARAPRPGTTMGQNEPGVGRTGPAGAPEPVPAPAGMPPPASRRDGAFLQNEPDTRPAGRAGAPETATARVAPAAPRPQAAVLQNEPGRQEAGRQEARRTGEGQAMGLAPLAAATAGARSPAPRPGPARRAPVPPAPVGPSGPAQEDPPRRGRGTIEDPLIPQPMRDDPRLRSTGSVPTARIDHREPPLILPAWWWPR